MVARTLKWLNWGIFYRVSPDYWDNKERIFPHAVSIVRQRFHVERAIVSESTPLSSLAAGARDTVPMMVGAVPLAIIYGALVAAGPWRSGMGG
jgi:hypothetical protein